ncbi:hypothetical protein CMI37_30120 [Candidatus Pacearchaeota archaeon]|nr:hypothetical protein [Candidatus Pacearchaeota archaeon]
MKVKSKKQIRFEKGILISFFCLLITLSFHLILYPAYLSMAHACIPQKDNFWLESKGYSKTGEFITGNKSSGKKSLIKVFNNKEETMVHELCHQVQYKEHRLYSCKHKILRYINEIECYFKKEIFKL